MCNLICEDNNRSVRAYIIELTDYKLKVSIPRSNIFLDLERKIVSKPFVTSFGELDFKVSI